MDTPSYENGGRSPRGRRGQIVDTGIDWVTVTASHNETAPALKSLASRIFDERLEEGNQVRACPGGRYRGFSTRGIAYGERDEDVSLTLSSDTAARYGLEVLALARTVSRLDVQVTALMPRPDTRLAHRAYQRALKGTGRKGRPATSELQVNSDGKLVAYIGSMNSDRQLRIYDKGTEAETGNKPGELWRCEATFRRKPARRAGDALLAVDTLEVGTEAMVRGELTLKGGNVFWLGSERDLRIVGLASHPSDAERKLRWLSAQVAPTIQWLLANNRREEVLAALGLSD